MAAEIRTTTLVPGNSVVRAAPGTMYGYWFQNSGGATAVITIYDNTTAAGTKILTIITLATTVGTGLVIFPQPIRFTVGISLSVATGTLTGSMVLVD